MSLVITAFFSATSSFIIMQGLSRYLNDYFDNLGQAISSSVFVSIIIIFLLISYNYEPFLIRFSYSLKILSASLIIYPLLLIPFIYSYSFSSIYSIILVTFIYLVLPIGIGIAIFIVSKKVKEIKTEDNKDKN